MATPETTTVPLERTETGDAAQAKLLDGHEEAFLKALCELLEIQARRSEDAVVICPDGPSVLH